MWDRQYELAEYLKHVWDKDEDKPPKNNFSIDFEDAE